MKELLTFIRAAKDLHDNWNENYDVGYPFQKGFGEVVFDVYNWFRAVHNVGASKKHMKGEKDETDISAERQS